MDEIKIGRCRPTPCLAEGEVNYPTGAITPLPLKDKQLLKMGLAVFPEDSCIRYRLYENCIIYEEHCPPPLKAIVFDRKMAVNPE